MLNSIKAISLGIITILALGLVFQLIFMMTMVGYTLVAKSYPIFLQWSQIFTYVFSGISYFIVMFVGGLVISSMAVKHSYPKVIAGSIIGSCISLFSSLQDGIFTAITVVFVLFGIFSSLLGCWYYHNHVEAK